MGWEGCVYIADTGRVLELGLRWLMGIIVGY